MAEPSGQAEPESPRWTVKAFLTWGNGTDTRYELVNGEIVAMTPPMRIHGRLVARLVQRIGTWLQLPCDIHIEAGIRLPDREDAYYQADLAVSCAPHGPEEQHVPDPILIAEVLSPSTAAHERGTKLPDYRTLPSVQEILLVSSQAIHVELWQRTGAGWMVTDLRGGEAQFVLRSVNLAIPLAVLYEGMRL